MKPTERSTVSSGICSWLMKTIYRNKFTILVCFSMTIVFAVSQQRRRPTTDHENESLGFILMTKGQYCVDGEICLSNDGNIYLGTSQYFKAQPKCTIDEAIKYAMSILHSCPKISPILLGRKDYYLPDHTPNIQDTERDNPLVLDGGHYKPPNCIAKWKVAIIIPYRNRKVHLLHFLDHMHPLLQRQQIDYRIYVINQHGNSTFNRGKLINIGFIEMTRDDDYDCVVFQDVDLLLENDLISYGCRDLPTHLAVAISTHNYSLSYEQYTGGVTQFPTKHFQKINGFSNQFWGWGGEDDDLFFRVYTSGLNFSRYPIEVSRFYMFKHDRDKGNEVNEARYDQLHEGLNQSKHEGLNSINYKVVDRQKKRLYYNITVDVLAPAVSMIKTLKESKRRGSSKEMKEIRKNAVFNNLTLDAMP